MRDSEDLIGFTDQEGGFLQNLFGRHRKVLLDQLKGLLCGVPGVIGMIGRLGGTDFLFGQRIVLLRGNQFMGFLEGFQGFGVGVSTGAALKQDDDSQEFLKSLSTGFHSGRLTCSVMNRVSWVWIR